MRRALALAAAVLLVAGALWLRDRDGGDGDGATAGGGPVRLTCATEVAEACERLGGSDVDVTVEPAGRTAAALVEGTGDLDAWLTLSPWPQIVDAERDRAGQPAALGAAGEPLARSPLVITAVTERANVLEARCRDRALDWRCIGEAAGEDWVDVGGEPTWGAVRPVHPPADQSATGLLVVGQLLATWFETADVSSTQFEDDAFRGWFSRLERAVPPPSAGVSLVRDQIVLTGSYDFVGALEAEAVPLLERAGARGEHVEVVYPSPMATADVVLVGRAAGGDDDALDAERVTDALRATGWKEPGGGDTGLPDAGVLDAARALWAGVV